MAERIDYTEALKGLMRSAGISSYRALAELADVSRWQVQQLKAGKVNTMRVSVLIKLSRALQVSLPNLMARFGIEVDGQEALRQEYQRLQQQMVQQQEDARSRFEAASLRTLETWLVQWPTIVKRAQASGSNLPAEKILPFVRPVESLVAEWGVEAIAPVDSQVPYDPQYHQLIGDIASSGDLVTVTHSGAMHKGKLLHRAKVKRCQG